MKTSSLFYEPYFCKSIRFDARYSNRFKQNTTRERRLAYLRFIKIHYNFQERQNLMKAIRKNLVDNDHFL